MFDESDPLRPGREVSYRAPCTRGDAVNAAVKTGLVAHLTVCAVCFVVMSVRSGGSGILWGFGIAATLILLWPVIVILAAAAIGIVMHLMFHQHSQNLLILVRCVTVAYEVALFGWIIIMCVRLGFNP